MTGIERLRALAYKKNFLEPAEARELDAIADQIERELDATVADSPYDALPPDDREAIAWVREHGGLDAVKRRWECLSYYADPVPRSCMEKRLARLRRQIDESHAALRRRNARIAELERERVKRPAPKVLDADGVEVEVGDDLYSVEGMLKFHVSAIDKKSGRIATEAMFALDKWADPKMYTHRAPVLAADGKPLREGETVWDKDGTELEVVAAKVLSDRPNRVNVVRKGEFVVHTVYADRLTHERPEIDSWERLEEDADKDPCDYFGFDGEETCGKCPASGKNCEQTMARDLVRRAKALAERER